MDTTSVADIESIHTMIPNDIMIKTLHKDELCKNLKSTKLNFGESLKIFQQIKSGYEALDRLDIIRNISFDFGETKNINITNALELLRIFGKCIEWDGLDSIIEVIESISFRNKSQNNKNINNLKMSCSYNFHQVYDILNKIADENDAEAMSFVINEKIHETKNEDSRDIFSYSLEKSNFNLIRLMIEFGINHTQPLLAISRELNTKNAKCFFKILQFDFIKNQALILASRFGCHEVVKLLLTVPGIDVNAKNEYNSTALILASYYGHHEVVKLLLTVPGIDVNLKNKYNTALIWAIWQSHHEVVKLLLTVPGIDVNAKDKDNRSALILASRFSCHKIVKLLLTVPGIDVNAKDKLNNTALIWASWQNNHEVVKLLLTVPGIDINAKNDFNRTALICASANNYHDIEKLLNDYGAI